MEVIGLLSNTKRNPDRNIPLLAVSSEAIEISLGSAFGWQIPQSILHVILTTWLAKSKGFETQISQYLKRRVDDFQKS
jgi:hypothetical protein